MLSSIEPHIDFSSSIQVQKLYTRLSLFGIRSCFQSFMLYVLFLYCFTLKMKTRSSFETSGTFDPMIRHIAGDLHLYFFPLSDRHIGISVSLRWRHDRAVAACALCTLQRVAFSKLFSYASFE